MTNIVFLDKGTFGGNVFDEQLLLPKLPFKHNYTEYDKTSSQDTLERCIDADYIITNKVVFNSSLLAKLKNTKHIAIAATGTNCVDLNAAKEMNISVSNVPGYGTRSVSEHVMALIFGLKRNLIAYREEIQAGTWQASQQFCFFTQPINDLSGTTIGLIGTGEIAQNIAAMAECFGMKTVLHSLSGRTDLTKHTLVSLDELLQNSDIISIHCPLTPASENLIDASTLALMKTTAILINTARGQIVNLEDLYESLRQKHIAGAGLDVAPQEPPDSNSTIMQLNKLPNCIVTPHTAWASIEAMQVLLKEVFANIEASHNNNNRNIVN